MRLHGSMPFSGRCAVAAAAVMLALSAAAAQPPRNARVDLTSSPDGAEVAIDGTVRGVTPLALFDLCQGRHHVRFSLKGYEGSDDFFTIDEAPHVSRHATLAVEKGLLLVTSNPDGCEITLDGYSLGTTPRLVTTLDANKVHKLVLSKTGYQSKTVEVRFSGRTPLVRNEKLVLDSGSLKVESEPSGAKVVMNGIDRGVTPLLLTEIPRGRVTISLEKEGYEPEKREIVLSPGDAPTLSIPLKAIPGSLLLTSVPDGARFYLDGEACGRAPVTIDPVTPGVHLVRAELEGCGTIVREVTVGLAKHVSEEFRLENNRGRLEVRTSPSGAQVFVDGRSAGITKASGQSQTMSDVLMVENLDAGEHTLVVKRDGYAEVVKHPVVEVSKTTKTSVRMQRVFTPNVVIATWSGEYKGVFVDRTAEAITIEVKMGILRTFPISDIREVKWLLEGAGK